MSQKNNIVLVGMPSAGKSTIGVLLAKAMNKNFIDTDVFIQQNQGKALQTLVDELGLKKFCKLEEEHVMKINCSNTVIATGGSVPYSSKAMEHLKFNGVVVYLWLTVEKIRQRITDFSTRGLVIDKSQSLEQLYCQRGELYEKYADITIDTTSLDHEQTLKAIIKAIGQTT